MEDDLDDDIPQEAAASLPNKKRLTPLSILLCDTILGVHSRILLKVFFDPGSTVTFISQKCLPRLCKPCPAKKTWSINMLAGSCTINKMVILQAVQLPELLPNLNQLRH
jgi:hypothetical protein